MTTPSTTQELRQFLDQCVNETKPVTYTDRAGHAHLVFLTKADEVTVRTKPGRDESALALTMIETIPEAQEGGPSGARAQEIFLLQCVDSTVPIEYQDRLNRKHRVFLTRMSLAKRVATARPDEWQYQLTMVDAWGGVWVYALPTLQVSVTATLTLRDYVLDVIGRPSAGMGLGFSEIGARLPLAGLVAAYELNEASGERRDAHTNALHLTDRNTVTQAEGGIAWGCNFPHAARFVAANKEYLSHVHDPLFSFTDSFTECAWVYLDSMPAFGAYYPILMHAVYGGKWNGWELTLQNMGSPRFQIYVGDDTGAWQIQNATSLGAPSVSRWYCVCAWRDTATNTLNIQVNNGAVDSSPLTCGLSPGAVPFYIGAPANGEAAGTGYFMNGRIAHVRLWNRVLTADERRAVFDAPPYPS